MNNTSLQAALLALSLDRNGPVPMHVQLAAGLRRLILSRHARPGQKLPSSRALAAELSVSRVTVLSAIEQLSGEGYLQSRPGSGLFVSSDLPEDLLMAGRDTPPLPGSPIPRPEPWGLFRPGVPDQSLFPHANWARLLDRAWRRPEPALLAAPDPLGWGPLREAIATHLRAWRGLSCSGQQVIITSGAAETFRLLSRSLFTPGSTILHEEPGYRLLRDTLLRSGHVHAGVPVDKHGFSLELAGKFASQAAGCFITPSRQYPLGITMPLSRRLELLGWARDGGRFIVEDDYDSEFRYRGRPLPALTSLDDSGHTVYAGTFSRVLSTSIRIAFVVVPPSLIHQIAATMTTTGPQASLVPQPALARFMESGDFAAHLRRMRRTYARRQACLLERLRKDLPDLLEVAEDPSGMHLVCGLAPGPAARMDDAEAATRANTAGLAIRALSSFYYRPPVRQALLIGYAGFSEDRLTEGTKRLAAALRTR